MTAFILVLVALILTAMLLGVHLSGVFGLNPAMNALDFDVYLRTKQSFDVVMPRFAKPLMLGTLISTAVAAFVAILQLEVGASLACGVGLVALAVTLLAILRGDLPINQAMASWSPEDPPDDWQQVRARWERFFAVRTTANAVALLALCVATALVPL